MKIQGVNITGGVRLDPPVAPTPTGPSKFVVGAPFDDDPSNSGSVYMYNTDGTGEQKITASDGADNDRFGWSVAVTDTKIVVGAYIDDDAGINSGSAYVYNTDGTGEVKITASDGAASDYFGSSVAISDTKVIVGAPNDDDAGSNSGSVYVYNTDGTGEQKITASDSAIGDQFGSSVAVTDTHIVVGGIYADNDNGLNSGAVYVYNTDGTGEQKIVASDGTNGDQFGAAVAIHGDKIIVSAWADDSSRGAVYVYNTDGTGEVKITASDGATNVQYGWSVAIHGNKVVVGASADDAAGINSGSAYVYNTDGTGEVKITASDAASGDLFGSSVCTDGQNIFVGAQNANAVYIYNMDGTGEQKIQASDAASGDLFGWSVAIN
jgi:hypothetical protein